MNTSSQVETGLVKIYGNGGSPLPVRQVGTPSSLPVIPYTINPGGHFTVVTDASPPDVNVGAVQIIPNSGTTTPVGAAIIGYTSHGVLVTETGVPSSMPTQRARIYVDTAYGHNTGIALAAVAGGSANVILNAFQTDGASYVGTAGSPLAVNGHDARFVTQFFSQLPAGFTGVVDISASTPFVAVTLRSLSNGRGDFLLTTFPVADINQIVGLPLIFPQVADGGGYQTQFILIDPSPTGNATTVNLDVLGDNGTKLLAPAPGENDILAPPGVLPSPAPVNVIRDQATLISRP
jgi:hypothetical protein